MKTGKIDYTNMNIKDRVKGCYLGWFFGPGAILRKDLTWNYKKIKEDPIFSKINSFEKIPSDYKMYDQLTQTLIVHDILIQHGKVTPELFKEYFLNLNKKDNILNNDQYGPSSQKAVKNLLEGKNPRETGKDGLTTGGAMRCMPIGIFFYNDIKNLLKYTYESCIISHNTDVAVSSAQAVNLMIAFLLKGKSKEIALKNTIKILKENSGIFGEPTAFAQIYDRIDYAVKIVKNKSFEEATELIANKIGFSWYAIEQIPAAFAIFFSTNSIQEVELMSFKLGYGHTAPQIACAFYGAEKGAEQFPENIVRKIEEVNKFSISKLYEEMILKKEIK